MSWYHCDIVIDCLPDDCVGFVYLIENLTNNRKYVGKKLAKFSKTSTKTITLKSGVKKKKKIKTKIDSDWMQYYGSSIELNKDVAELGVENFRREILHFCISKAECSYKEAMEQFQRKVLESTEYYNNNIMCRIHGSHILGKV